MAQGSVNSPTMMKAPKRHLGQLWPLSIITMAFTVLSQLEATQSISIYVSYAVSIWKQLLERFYEGLINFVLELIKIPPIDISSPWPETLFIATMMLFCFLHGDKIRNFSLSRKIAALHLKTFKIFTTLNPESWTGFTASITLSIIQHFPTYLILFALFGVSYLTLFLCVAVSILSIAAGHSMLTSIVNKLEPNRYAKAHGTFIGTLSFLITLFAILVLGLAVSLETAAPQIQDFIQNANQYDTLKNVTDIAE